MTAACCTARRARKIQIPKDRGSLDIIREFHLGSDPLELGAWDLFGPWNLGFGICFSGFPI
jgi:hypothetical protein